MRRRENERNLEWSLLRLHFYLIVSILFSPKVEMEASLPSLGEKGSSFDNNVGRGNCCWPAKTPMFLNTVA